MDQHQEERRMLADSVAGFSRHGDAIGRARRQWDQAASLDREIWGQMAELGWLGILVPEDAGGVGLDVPEMAVVAEGLGGACAPEPVAAVGFAQSVIAAGDNTELARQLLAASADGSRLSALAWQNTPEDLQPEPVSCLAERTTSGTVLTGTRHLVLPAEADDFIISARTPDGPALYCIPRDAAGLEISTRNQIDGSGVLSLRLDRVPVDETDLLASPATALPALERGLCVAATLASAELLGLAGRLLDITMDYLGTRKQFGSPISSFQVLRHRAVNLYIQQQLMRAALRQAVRAFDQRQDLATLRRAASRAKARTSDAGCIIAREAVQFHGAIGYTEEADVGIHLRRILTLSAWLGNAAWHRRRYADLIRADT